MSTQEIRSKFIEFFTKIDHKYIPPSPVINKSDPTLMFTNAGMNQFKDIFLGNCSTRFLLKLLIANLA